MAETHVCEQLAQGRYPAAERRGIEPATQSRKTYNLSVTAACRTIERSSPSVYIDLIRRTRRVSAPVPR